MMKPDEIRALWKTHVDGCAWCQNHSFSRCAAGDELLAQLVEADPLYSDDSGGLSLFGWLRGRMTRRRSKGA